MRLATLGYEKGPDGQPRIVEDQAETVRLIYKLFLDGLMPSGIAKKLTERGIPSPAGKQVWYSGTVESILTNEKYKGDALLQKTFCVNFLTKEMKRNEGELPQYYVEQSHPAIISPEVFDEVQQELKRRRDARYVGRSGCFSSKIICGECGSYYGRKVWHAYLVETLDLVMLHNPENWMRHYPPHSALMRRFSLSDRNRYYMNTPEVEEAVARLLSNLSQREIPLALVSQFLPKQYEKIRLGSLQDDPRAMVLDHIRETLGQYWRACGLCGESEMRMEAFLQRVHMK